MVCFGARRAVALVRNIEVRCVIEEKTHVHMLLHIHAEARSPSSSASAEEVVHAESRTIVASHCSRQ